jgi:hypothetical protein
VRKIFLPIFLSVFVLLISSDAFGQTKVRVRFKKGANSASVIGQISDYKYIDYIVRAKSGQTMKVSLKSTHASCSFAVFYSDMKNVSDAADVRNLERNVDVDDDYIIRVLMPRSAARRRESANFTLRIEIN